MSRYCELKLIDILKEENQKSSKKVNKITTVNRKSKNMSTRTRFCEFSQRKPLFPSATSSVLMETRESRMAVKSKNCSGSNTFSQNADANCRNLRKASGSKAEKRKRNGEKEKNIQESPCNKIVTKRTSHLPPSSNADKRIIEKKKKKKSKESFWENKLTGARRVSKRLSNLKIKKEKSLKNFGLSKSQVSMEGYQSINYSARGRTKSNKVTQRKASKKRRTSYDRNFPEHQYNYFGKLSHTKRLYPKISAGRRPPTFTVTIKPSSSDQQSHDNEQYISTCDEDSISVNSTISMDVKIIEDDINIEANREEVAGSDETEDIRMDTLNDQSESKKNDSESNSKNSTEECESLTCEDEEYSDSAGSTIVMVDIESSENVEFDSSEEEKKGKEKIVSEISCDERKIAEEQSNGDHSDGTVPINQITPNHAQEEKSINENYSLITVFSETDSSQASVNEGRPTSSTAAEDSGIDLLQVIETIEITNVKVPETGWN